jgi:hypothetical protein
MLPDTTLPKSYLEEVVPLPDDKRLAHLFLGASTAGGPEARRLLQGPRCRARCSLRGLNGHHDDYLRYIDATSEVERTILDTPATSLAEIAIKL